MLTTIVGHCPESLAACIGTPKNGRTREVPLSKQAIEALQTHPYRGETVFTTTDRRYARQRRHQVATMRRVRPR